MTWECTIMRPEKIRKRNDIEKWGGGWKHGIKENGRSVHKVIRIKANEKKSAVKKTVNSRQEITLFGWIAWCKIIIKQKIPCVYLLIIKRNKRRRSKNIFRGVSEVIHNILFYVVLFLSHFLFFSNKTSRRKKLFNQMGVSVFWLKERTWAARRFCSLYIHTFFSASHFIFSMGSLFFSLSFDALAFLSLLMLLLQPLLFNDIIIRWRKIWFSWSRAIFNYLLLLLLCRCSFLIIFNVDSLSKWLTGSFGIGHWQCTYCWICYHDYNLGLFFDRFRCSYFVSIIVLAGPFFALSLLNMFVRFYVCC